MPDGRLFRFRVADSFNEWAYAVEVWAPDEETARRRADHWLFARREVGKDVELRLDGRQAP